MELIKLAGAASGFEYTRDANPLIDDSLAFRLAVKLNLQVTFDMSDLGQVVKVSIPWGSEHFDSEYEWIEYLHDDALAATRRAVIRCAAEIGEYK